MKYHIEERVAHYSTAACIVLVVAQAANTAAASACLEHSDLSNENEYDVAIERVIKGKIGSQRNK